MSLDSALRQGNVSSPVHDLMIVWPC